METIEKGVATAERMLLWRVDGHHAPDATSAKDMLAKSGLDWTVGVRDIFTKNPDGTETSGDHRKAIVREDTNAMLGVVKSRYVPFSNVEVFDFLDNLTDSGEALYEAAWAWHGGETVGVALRLPETVKIGGFDEHSMNLLVRTSHDGGGSLTIAATPVRIACTNAVNATIRGAERVWKTAHTGTLAGKIMHARQSLEMVMSYGDAWDIAAQEMIAKTITKDRFAEMAKELFGEKHVEPAVSLRDHADNLEGIRTTAYGAYNALTEYAQWTRPRNAHLDALVRGNVGRQTARAYELVNA